MNLVVKERDAADIAPLRPLGPGPRPGRPVSLAAVPARPQSDNSGAERGRLFTRDISASDVQIDERLLDQEFQKANHNLLLAMSDEELQKHAEELHLSVTSKSLEIMQSVRFKKKVGLGAKSPAGGSKSDEGSAGPSPPTATTSVLAVPTSFDSFISMPNTEEELDALKRTAPLEWKRQVEWTIPRESLSASSNGPDASVDGKQSFFSRSLNRSKYDRFDLNGNKVIDKEETIADVGAVFEILGLSQEATRILASQLVDNMLQIKFCVEPNAPDTQPQDELLQHEQDPDKPGYSFMEISEMFRSEEKHQRGIAIEMLSGILRNREDAVTLEPYGQEAAPASKIKTVFQAVLKKMDAAMATEQIWTQRDGMKDGCSSELEKRASYLRRILTFAILLMCTADLPVALPTLLLWGLNLRMAVPARLQLLKCLRYYLFSTSEEMASAALWNGLWGVYGYPALQTPHDRRMECSYEEYVAHCVACRDKEITAEEATDNPQAPPSSKPQKSLQDEFASRNRWGRVDAMFQDGDLVQCLSAHLNFSLPLVLSTDTTDASAVLLLDASTRSVATILEISAAAARIGELETVEIIVASVIKKNWTVFHGQPAQSKAVGTEILSRWFRLLAEALRRSPTLPSWVASQRNFMSQLLGVVLRKTSDGNASDDDSCVWGLRVWRVLLCNSHGISTVSELLMAAQTPRAAPRGAVASSFAIGPGLSLCCEHLPDFLAFLEQAAVTSASLIVLDLTMEHSDSPAPRLFELVELSQLIASLCASMGTRLLLDPALSLSATQTLLNFIASVLGPGYATTQGSTAPLFPLSRAAALRGPGLVFACLKCVSHFHQSGFEIDARLLHLQSVVEEALSTYASLQSVGQRLTSLALEANSTLGVSQWCLEELHVAMRRFILALTATRHDDTIHLPALQRPSPSRVCDGLYRWQSHRLRQAGTLLELQKSIQRKAALGIPLTATKREISGEVMLTLSGLGHGLSGPAAILLTFLLDLSLEQTVAGHKACAQLKEKILVHLFCPVGFDREALQFQIDVSTQVLEGMCLSVPVATWIRFPFNSKIPISENWYLSTLPGLSGELFVTWLETILTMESHGSNPVVSASVRCANLAEKLYCVLRMANPEHCLRWSDSESLESSPKAGLAFCSLVVLYFVRLLSEPSIALENSPASIAFSKATVAETFDPRTLSKPARAIKPGDRSGDSNSGVLELCGKLLDSATAPLLDHDSHSCSLLVMICPALTSLKVQQKVWLELGTARCLHLLESPMAVSFVPVFALSWQIPQTATTSRAILAALESLRRPSDENSWTVCSIGVLLLAGFLFGGVEKAASHSFLLDAAKSRFLFDMVSSSTSKTHTRWILRHALSFAASGSQMEAVIKGYPRPWSVEVASKLGVELLGLWGQVRMRCGQQDLDPAVIAWAKGIEVQVPGMGTPVSVAELLPSAR